MKSLEFEIDDSVLEKINRLTRKPLTKDKLYCFPLVLCDNEADRDNEYFTPAALEKLAELFVGKTGVFDHDASGRNQTARIFDTELVKDESALTSLGEPLISLTARAYMVRTAHNRDLIDEIDAGIKKEVSVSCSVAKKVCSICGKDVYSDRCAHAKGRKYNGKKCVHALEEPLDAYEWSFVAVPAQKNAGVKKSCTYISEKNTQPQADEKLLKEYRELTDRLFDRARALWNAAGMDKELADITLGELSPPQLLDMEDRLRKKLSNPGIAQTAAADNKNLNYKLDNERKMKI